MEKAGEGNRESEALRLKLGRAYAEIEQNVALRLRLGQVYFEAEKFAKAAEQFAPVLVAATHAERLPDDEKAKEALLREIGERCGEMGDCFLAANRLSEARGRVREVQRVAAQPGDAGVQSRPRRRPVRQARRSPGAAGEGPPIPRRRERRRPL